MIDTLLLNMIYLRQLFENPFSVLTIHGRDRQAGLSLRSPGLLVR